MPGVQLTESGPLQKVPTRFLPDDETKKQLSITHFKQIFEDPKSSIELKLAALERLAAFGEVRYLSDARVKYQQELFTAKEKLATLEQERFDTAARTGLRAGYPNADKVFTEVYNRSTPEVREIEDRITQIQLIISKLETLIPKQTPSAQPPSEYRGDF